VSKSNITLQVTKTSLIKKGEPVVFTFPQAAGTVKWNVTPDANTQINASGNKSSILFGIKGSYTVSAISGSFTASSTVSVTDSVYNGDTTRTGGGGGTPVTTLPFVSGEVINITVSRIDSGSVSGLLFSAQTTNSYTCIGNSLISETTSGANSHTIKYTGIRLPEDCIGGTAKAGGFNYLYPISSGTSTLTILVNGTTYSGTIIKTGTSYTINWSGAGKVLITPTTL
jgi:hypothetical protein